MKKLLLVTLLLLGMATTASASYYNPSHDPDYDRGYARGTIAAQEIGTTDFTWDGNNQYQTGYRDGYADHKR